MAGGLCLLVGAWLTARYPVPLDFDVYRTAALFWIHDGDVYGQLPFLTDGGHLPFTYPPFALLLFLPTALMSIRAGFFVLAVASVAICSIVLARVVAHGELAWYVLVTAVLAVGCEPVAETFSLGQINLVLMGLASLVLTSERARTWAAVALGIAAAVKLTPAALALWFIVRRDWRGAATFAAASAGCLGIGFVTLPAESRQYWLTTLWDPTRIGHLEFPGNQSINGLIHRLGGGSLAWMIAVVVGGLVSYAAARALYVAGSERLAMVPVMLFPLLASPVSWSHHWVWGVVIMILLWTPGPSHRSGRPFKVLAVVGAALMVIAPHRWFFGASQPWDLGIVESLASSSYVL